MSARSTTAPRFAIYYAPHAREPLSAFARAWLGRDAQTDEPVPRPSVLGYPTERLIDVTRGPSLYGFHATLKPPFGVVAGISEERLEQTILALTASRHPIRLPPLQLSEVSGFLALTLRERCSALHALADDCVRIFDPFRRAADQAELARRRQCGLTARQEQLLSRWGYPFVMDQWRFHLTLTSRLEVGERQVLRAALQQLVDPVLQHSLTVDSICLFRQDNRLSPFRLVSRYSFGK